VPRERRRAIGGEPAHDAQRWWDVNRGRVLLPAIVVGLVLCMFVPLPTVLLDALLAVNIVTSIVILASVIGIKDPVEFSAYPTMLLVTTASRLALTISTTRSILLHGYAGEVVQTFGEFVVGANVVVGLVMFVVLTIVNLMVITKGSERASEVAARFSLDAMPGKQMAVDADLAAGLLDEAGARAARKRIAKESDFYGAMDGAVKFVKGDAVAGLIVAAINLLGGFGIGVAMRGLSLGESAQTYALLTVGDGLVAQIPALVIALATGLLVNRVRGDNRDVGSEIGAQLATSSLALRVGAGGAILIALLPGMPKIPFALAAIGLWVMAGRISDGPAVVTTSPEQATVAVSPDDSDVLIATMRVEPLELRLAYDCIDLLGGDLMARVREVRRQLATELGFVLPQVVTVDDATLAPGQYRISVHGVDVGRGIVPTECVLALPDPSFADGDATLAALGERVVEPVFGLIGYWVPQSEQSAAAAGGATIVTRSAAVVTHIAEVARTHAHELLSRQQVADLVEGLRIDHPLLANEVGGERLPIGTLHDVLRSLLAERVPIRDLPKIVETATAQPGVRTAEQLADECRAALGAKITYRLAPDGQLAGVLLVPELEGRLLASLRDVDGTMHLALDPDALDQLRNAVAAAWERSVGGPPVALMCAPALRRPLARVLAAGGIELPVLAYRELPKHVSILQTEVITA
jgi:flagellar biosynthesis protein FlhA